MEQKSSTPKQSIPAYAYSAWLPAGDALDPKRRVMENCS